MKAYLISYMFSHGSAPSLKAREITFINTLSDYLFQNRQLKSHYHVEQMAFAGKSVGYALCSSSVNGVRATRILKVGFKAYKTSELNEYKLHMQIACASNLINDNQLCPLEILDALEKSDNPKVSSLWLQDAKKQHAQKALKARTKKGQLFIRCADTPLLPNTSLIPHFAIYEGKGVFKVLNDQGWVEVIDLPVAQAMEPIDTNQLPAIEHHSNYEVQSGIVFAGANLIGRLPTSRERQGFISARLSASQAQAQACRLHTQQMATFTSGQWFN